MSTKGYFGNLQNRYSANFVAMASCISLVYAIVIFLYHVSSYNQAFDLTDFLFNFWFISTAILGYIILFIIFPLSIPVYFLLKNKIKDKIYICITFLIMLCITLFVVLAEKYELTHDMFSVLSIVANYFHMYKILLPIFIFIPFICIADSQKNILISNTNITNNKIYKYCIYFFFYYFWFQYIPFVLGLLVYFYVGLQ